MESSLLGADPGARIQGGGSLGSGSPLPIFGGPPNFIKGGGEGGGITCIHVNVQCFIMSTAQETVQKIKKSMISQGTLATPKILIQKLLT